MKENNIRTRKQFIQCHIFCQFLSCIALESIVRQHLHIQRVQQFCSCLTNPAKTDDTGCFSIQFDHRIIPITPVFIILPFSGFNSFIMMSVMRTDLQEQTQGILSYDLCSIGRNVYYRDSLLFCVCVIHYIVSCGKDSDQSDISAFIDGLFGDRRFVDHNNLRVSDPFCDQRRFFIGSPVIYCHFSQFLQSIPA